MATAERLGLEQSLRPRGRLRKAKLAVSDLFGAAVDEE